MKKILFGLLSLMLCGFGAKAQLLSGNITGTVVDANQVPLPGVAVFYYGSTTQIGTTTGQLNVNPNIFRNWTYTDANGHYTISYWANQADTLVVGALDCQRYAVLGSDAVYSTSPNTTINLQMSCAPLDCDVVFDTTSYMTSLGRANFITAVSLRDSLYTNLNSPITHTWFYNGITRTGMANFGPNQDSIMILGSTIPTICYQRTPTCGQECLGSNPSPNLNCNASFYVDSVNSINFQGQVVIWENSTTDSTAVIVAYHWDFGDGTSSGLQYPIHTYNDTNIYNVCLTITSVSASGADTCISTYCDSIGFDSNGNLRHKSTQQGFTINVIDPATVGQEENTLDRYFSLYPNPNNGKATLNWDRSIRVESIDVISINGKLIRTLHPTTSGVEFHSLSKGVYILRVQSSEGVADLKMMVQ